MDRDDLFRAVGAAPNALLERSERRKGRHRRWLRPLAAVLALALLGGAAMYSGVFIMSSGIAFFTVRALDWIYIFTNASYQVTRIPMPYLPRALKGAFTFVVPMLVISYYPASALCGWGDPPALGLLALPAGLAFLGASLLVWRLGVRHYRSAGS